MTAPDPHGRQLPLGPQFVEQLPPKKNTVLTVVSIVIMALAALAVAVILVIALSQSTVPLLAVSIVLALFTLAFVWLVVWFIDRWEPEPKLVLFGALAWGAGISTGGTLLVGLIMDLVLGGFLPDWWGTVVQAPVLEEFFKGLGVLVIFFIARKHFNGPTDGIVIGALSGAGFAFTENILYFSSVAAQGFESGTGAGVVALGYQFLVRGVAMPLLHPICASLTGAAIGFGARRGSVGAAVIGFVIGLVPAMVVHAIWNGGVTIIDETTSTVSENLLATLGLFAFAMVPIFVGWIVFIVVLRRGDRKLLRERLGEYAQVGWYSSAEVQMLTTMSGRSGARSWAKRLGPEAVRAMRQFIEESSRLAHVRHQVLLDPRSEQKRRAEMDLLSDLTRVRRVLSQSQRTGMQQMQTVSSFTAPASAPTRMPQPYFPQQAPQHAHGAAGAAVAQGYGPAPVAGRPHQQPPQQQPRFPQQQPSQHAPHPQAQQHAPQQAGFSQQPHRQPQSPPQQPTQFPQPRPQQSPSQPLSQSPGFGASPSPSPSPGFGSPQAGPGGPHQGNPAPNSPFGPPAGRP